MGEKQSKTYRDQQRLAVLGLLGELPNFVVVLISAILSSSLLMWLDVVDSTGNVLNALLVAILSRKLKRNLKYDYNYGIGKIESVASLCCESLAITGLAVIIICAIRDIIFHEDPGDYLLFAMLIKLVNITVDGLYAYAQWKIQKNSHTILTKSEYDQALRATIFDVITFVSLFITWAFDDTTFASYFAPIITMALAVFYLIRGIFKIRHSISILADKTLPEEQQLLILKVLNGHYAEYEEFTEIDSHLNGMETIIDIHITFSSGTTFQEMQDLGRRMNEEINEVIPESTVNLVINNTLHA